MSTQELHGVPREALNVEHVLQNSLATAPAVADCGRAPDPMDVNGKKGGLREIALRSVTFPVEPPTCTCSPTARNPGRVADSEADATNPLICKRCNGYIGGPPPVLSLDLSMRDLGSLATVSERLFIYTRLEVLDLRYGFPIGR